MSTAEAQLILSRLEALQSDLRRLRDEPRLEAEWLSVKDVAEVTGFSEYKVKQMRRRGQIRMFLPPGSNEWRITRKAFDAWERRVVEEGTPMEARYPAR